VQDRHHVPAYPWKSPSPVPAAPGTVARRAIFARLLAELRNYAVCLQVLWRSDILVVCGTNVVSDYMTGPRGWPYDLFKWSGLATLCGVRVVFVGVGVGPVYHSVSRWLIKRSLGFADYRSYRDEVSRQWAKKVGVRTDRDVVGPDLVFGLSQQSLAPKNAHSITRPVVGLGLKDYKADLEGVARGEYQRYIDTMAAFAGWLCENGFNVRLLIGDFSHDTSVTQDVLTAARDRRLGEDRVVADPALTVEDLIDQIAESDAVVSPRFHNIVLGLLLNKPVICLSDHHKLDALMDSFALAEYTLPLADLRAEDLSELFQRVRDRSPELKVHIRAKVAESRAAVSEQYEAALAAAGASPSPSGRFGAAPSLGT
jgi:polysaccharide pyruvyl transferase WcaK-like protein